MELRGPLGIEIAQVEILSGQLISKKGRISYFMPSRNFIWKCPRRKIKLKTKKGKFGFPYAIAVKSKSLSHSRQVVPRKKAEVKLKIRFFFIFFKLDRTLNTHGST
jgi:hypothetical protein